MAFTLLPESSLKLPFLARGWVAAAALHVLLWISKLFLQWGLAPSDFFIPPSNTRPLSLWSWIGLPLLAVTAVWRWRRGVLRYPLRYAATILLWLGLWISLPTASRWMTERPMVGALMTGVMLLFPLALSVTMVRTLLDTPAEGGAAGGAGSGSH